MLRKTPLTIIFIVIIIIVIGLIIIYNSNSLLFDRALYHLGFQNQVCKPFIQENNQLENNINFAVVGDIDTTKDSLKTLHNIASVNPELILYAGDLIYNNKTAKDWFEFSDFLGTDNIIMTFSETDRFEKESYLEHYALSNEFYSLNYDNVHFVVLSSELPSFENSEQTNFLIYDLESATNNSNFDWIIVLVHKPMYSSLESFIEFRENIQPIFDLYAVDIVLNGDVHGYERTKPLQFNGIVTSHQLCSYFKYDGQIYVTVGTGGHSHTKFHNQSTWSIIQNDNDYGFLNINLKNNGTELVGEFISNKGKIIDSFKISSINN